MFVLFLYAHPFFNIVLNHAVTPSFEFGPTYTTRARGNQIKYKLDSTGVQDAYNKNVYKKRFAA